MMRFAEWHEIDNKAHLEEVRAGNRCVIVDGAHVVSFALDNDALTADLEDGEFPDEVLFRAFKLMCVFGYKPR